MPVCTLTYSTRSTGAEKDFGIFRSAEHAKVHAQSWAQENLGKTSKWREGEQDDGALRLETEANGELHRFVIRTVEPVPDDGSPQDNVLGNEEPGIFFG